jgi:cytoskeleton protein RodZ
MDMNASSEYGPWIRAAREAGGKSIEEIAEVLRIDPRYLKALEAGNIELLPEPYMRAFLLTYAGHLGLDTAEAVRRFDAYHLAQHKGMEAVHAAVHEKQGRKAFAGTEAGTAPFDRKAPSDGATTAYPVTKSSTKGKWFAAAAVILLFGAAAWLAIGGLNLPDEFAQVPAPEPDRAPLSGLRDTVQAESTPPADEQIPVESPPVGIPRTEQDVSPPASIPSVPPRAQAELRAEALEEVWIQIVAAGDTLVSRILTEGQQVRIPFADTLVVRMGKNRGARLFLDDRELTDLGAPGMVLARLVVTTTGVVERRLVFPPDDRPRNQDDSIKHY